MIDRVLELWRELERNPTACAYDAHDPRAIVDSFAQRITPRTKVLMFSHVLTSSGLRMQGIPRLRVVSAPPVPRASPLVTYALPDGITGGQMQQRLLTKHQVMVKTVPAHFMNRNRISTHLFNTEQDVERLLHALRTELSS